MEHLDFNFAYPVEISYVFAENWQELADGREQVVPAWEQPKIEFTLSKNILSAEKLEFLIQFFEAQSGEVFLFKDPLDNYCGSFELESQPGFFTLGELHQISGNEYQLCKTYIAGDLASVRPISHPVNDNSFRIFSSTPYTVNWETGRVVFASQPTEAELTWQGYFLIPVVFAIEDWSYQTESNSEEYSFDSFKLIEYRDNSDSFVKSRPQSTNANLDLDLIVSEQKTITKKIAPVFADSGWYTNLKLWENSKTILTTSAKENSSVEDVEAAITLWRATCGGVISFQYQGQRVVCKSDRLNISLSSSFTATIGSLDLLPVLESSLLGQLDSQTYLITLVDSSGSMNADIPAVEATIAQLRPILTESVYNGSASAASKYFKPIQYIGDERWVEWLARDYRDSPSEPDKVFIMAWINESDSIYHSSALNTAPTAAYLSDLAQFQAKQRASFKAIIYAVEFQSSTFLGFQNHLNHAYEGTNGYPVALKDEEVLIRDSVPAGSPPQYYLEDLLAGSNEKLVNFYCRCWLIEPQASQYQAVDYGLTPIVPLQPPEQGDDFYAYVFGEFIDINNSLPKPPGTSRAKFRCRFPVKGRTINKYPEKFVIYDGETPTEFHHLNFLGIPDPDPEMDLATLMSVITDQHSDYAASEPDKNYSYLCPVTEAEYAARYTGDLSDRSVLLDPRSTSQVSGNYIACYYGQAFINDIISVDPITQGRQANAYFTFGQCSGVNYGFRADFNAGQTDVVGNISGKITAIRVYIHNGYYALSIDNEIQTFEPIYLTIAGNNFSLADQPKGIYNLSAIRLDAQPDECGHLFSLPTATPRQLTPLGFTNHDRRISFDGYDFLPNFGGNAQAKEYPEEMEVSSDTEITFMLSSSAISQADLLEGVYSQARITEWLVDWNNPGYRLKLATGYFGRTTTYSNQNGGLDFKVKMRSLVSRLQQKSYFITVKLCPKTVGDQSPGGCRLNLFGYIDTLTVTTVIDSTTFTVDSLRTIDNFYGEITFLTGARANVAKLVDSYSAATKTIKLRSSEPGIVPGDTLSALVRCDKSYQACLEFDNVHNHGGYRHVAGTDKAKQGAT